MYFLNLETVAKMTFTTFRSGNLKL